MVQPPGLVLAEANLEERRGDSIEIIIVKNYRGKDRGDSSSIPSNLQPGGRKKVFVFRRGGGEMQEFIHHS